MHWDILIFLLPIALAIVLGAGAVSGLFGDADVDIDVDVDVDVDADVDGDADGDTDGASWVTGVLSLLGVGRAPLTVLLSTGLLAFGGLGLILQPLIGTLLATLASLVSAPLAMGTVGRVLGRYAPSSETYATTAVHLIGCTGVARLPVSDGFGVAQVTDDHGSLHQIQCRVESGLSDSDDIAKGETLVVVDYDADAGRYTVARLEPLPN
ncbi:MAG: hypothetical protein AAGE52_29315 [Myxococcota bacterium]